MDPTASRSISPGTSPGPFRKRSNTTEMLKISNPTLASLLHHPDPAECIISLNVGGCKYSTTRDTLTRIKGSFFDALLSDKFSARKDEDGAIFIDREGKYFRYILDYLRTGDYPSVEPHLRATILKEADFYMITPLIQELHRMESDACGGRFFDCMLPGYKSPVKEMVSMENHLVVLHEDGKIRCWSHEVSSGWSIEFTSDDLMRPLSSSSSSEPSEFRLAFFASVLKAGRWFLAAFSSGRIHVWNKQGKFGFVPIKESELDAMFFVKKGQDLVAMNFEMGHIWILSLASLNMRTISHTSPLTASCHDAEYITAFCASSAAIHQLMIGHSENTLLQKMFSDPNKEEITALSCKDNKTLYYGTQQGTIRKIEVVLSHCQASLVVRGHIHAIRSISFLGNHSIVSLCDQDHVRCWSTEDNMCVSSYSCRSATLFPGLPFVIQIGQQSSIRIVEALTGDQLQSLHPVNSSSVVSFNICHDHLFPGGYVLITGHQDGSLQIWNLALLGH